MIVRVTEVDPICAMQACMDGFEVVSTFKDGVNDGSEGCINTDLLATTDLLVTSTGNFNVCNAAMLKALKCGAVVCNIGHFDNEIDTAYMRQHWEWEEVKPQVHKIYRDRASNDHLLLLSEGRLVNLGNATGHPSRIMDGSFANQVLAQIHLYAKRFADLPAEEKAANITVEVLPKHLDEQVAALMVQGFGGVITRLTEDQAKYIGVSVDGPFKTDSYKY
jgi:adenosylhomocysteinase